MEIGLTLRVMGPQSSVETLTECARAADRLGLDHLWVADHIAIPPDDAEGSGGRYLDALTTLAFLAAATQRIRLGTGVLILPYRPALPTAKQVATVQELSGGRLLLGIGIGWMEPEFRALAVPRRLRGAISDELLTFLRACFAGDEVEANGQRFLFLPRPARPPIYVGGAPPHALVRAVRHGDGWMPIARNPDALVAPIKELRALAERAGRPAPAVVALTSLPLDDPAKALERARAFEAVGVTALVHAFTYRDAAEYREAAAALADAVASPLRRSAAGAQS